MTPNFLLVVAGNLGYLGKLGNVAWTQNLSLIRKPPRARKRGEVQFYIVTITDTHENFVEKCTKSAKDGFSLWNRAKANTCL